MARLNNAVIFIISNAVHVMGTRREHYYIIIVRISHGKAVEIMYCGLQFGAIRLNVVGFVEGFGEENGLIMAGDFSTTLRFGRNDGIRSE